MRNIFLSSFFLLALSAQASQNGSAGQAQAATYDFYDYTVSGTECWTPVNNPVTRMNGGMDGIIRIQHSLTVPAGTRLTMDGMHIELGPQATVIIQSTSTGEALLRLAEASAGEAGELIVNATALTAYSSRNSQDIATWQGIVVEGSAIAGYGSFSMNGSTITDASAGVQYGTDAAKADTRLAAASNKPYRVMQPLQVWPSPNNGAFVVYMASALNEPVQIIVTDAKGQIIKETTGIANKETTIQTDASLGVYVITAVTAYGKQSAKVIVK